MSPNLAVVLRESARRHPHRTAIIADEHHTSWTELDAASDRLAEGLRRREVAHVLGDSDARLLLTRAGSRDPGDVAATVDTAGTTGRPKGAELTHFPMFTDVDTPGWLFGVREDDVVLVALPLFHVFALSSQLNLCVRFGTTTSLVPRFEPGRVREVMERDRVTVFEGVPTMYVAVLEHPLERAL